jgi:TIGR03009 family protein
MSIQEQIVGPQAVDFRKDSVNTLLCCGRIRAPMNAPKNWWATLSCLATLIAAPTLVVPCATAQVPPAPAGEARLQRPAPNQMIVEELPADLLKIMQDWEWHSAKIQTLNGKHTRIVYNLVFETERRSNGQFFYEQPDHGRIDMKGMEPGRDAVSRRNGKSGQPYRIEADKQERWVCTGQEVMQINDTEKTYEIYPLPPNMQGQNIINGPLPFLFGMKVDEAKRRFNLTLLGANDKLAKIEVIPRLQMDANNYKRAVIMLDLQTYLPSAVQLVDPAGALETVYVFSDLQPNHAGIKATIANMWGRDPFKPALNGYKIVQAPKVDAELVPASNQQPEPTTPGARQSSNSGFPRN